jgi:hypothetical protein
MWCLLPIGDASCQGSERRRMAGFGCDVRGMRNDTIRSRLEERSRRRLYHLYRLTETSNAKRAMRKKAAPREGLIMMVTLLVLLQCIVIDHRLLFGVGLWLLLMGKRIRKTRSHRFPYLRTTRQLRTWARGDDIWLAPQVW